MFLARKARSLLLHSHHHSRLCLPPVTNRNDDDKSPLLNLLLLEHFKLASVFSSTSGVDAGVVIVAFSSTKFSHFKN